MSIFQLSILTSRFIVCTIWNKVNRLKAEMNRFNILIVTLLCTLPAAYSVRCYQCASSQESKGDDTCGAYKKFDKESNIAVECGSDESHTPGAFCMKLTQQGPKGFIWDGRWRQVIRRCASISETGVTGVCNWGVYDNGVYWEECYCSSDECNSAHYLQSSITLVFLLILSIYKLW